MKKLIPILLFAINSFASLEVGDTAQCVVLDDIQPNGQVIRQCIRTPNQEGQSVLIDFAMPECPSCKDNLPILSNLSTDLPNNLTVRVVVSSKERDKIDGWLNDNKANIHFPTSIDIELAALHTYSVEATPTTFLLDSNNKVLFKHVGVLSNDDVQKIKSLIPN